MIYPPVSSMKQIRAAVKTFKRSAGIYPVMSNHSSRLTSREGISRGSSLPTSLDSSGGRKTNRTNRTNRNSRVPVGEREQLL